MGSFLTWPVAVASRPSTCALVISRCVPVVGEPTVPISMVASSCQEITVTRLRPFVAPSPAAALIPILPAGGWASVSVSLLGRFTQYGVNAAHLALP